MTPVILESPYAGDVETNVKYAKACVLDCLLRGEAAFASHLFYTQVLDDNIPEQRQQGIEAGLSIARLFSYTVVYTDLGISKGMEYGIEAAQKAGRHVSYRRISGWGTSNAK